MKNTKKGEQDLWEERIELIKAAFNRDIIDRVEIGKATGLGVHIVSRCLKDSKELRAEYNVRRKILVDLAADNIQAIVNDRNHPQHFAASKYILSKYKSDLDENLEAKDDESITIKRKGGRRGGSRVKFKFSK